MNRTSDSSLRLQLVDLKQGNSSKRAHHDAGGNRTATGERTSAASAYTPNRLNQYQSRTVAGAVDMLGVANPTQGVTVNGTTATQEGEYFHHALSVANRTAQYPTVTTVSASGAGQTSTSRFFVPAAAESFQHDAGGNLTRDGRRVIAFRCCDGRPAHYRRRSKPGRTPLRTRIPGFSRARVGYRFYNPPTGRWLNRDPIGERGDANLYCFVKNAPVERFDILGLDLPANPPPGGTPTPGDPGRWDVPYDNFEDYIEGTILGGPLTPGQKLELERGCVGQCRIIQFRTTGQPYTQMWPEYAKSTKCFKTQAEAQASKCDSGKQPFVFAKQGIRWRDRSKDGPKGYEPEPGQPSASGKEKGEIPPNSVWPDSTARNVPFNYIAVCRLKDKNGKEYTVYTWMNHAKQYGGSAGRVSDHPYPGDSTYQVTMWCRTCPD